MDRAKHRGTGCHDGGPVGTHRVRIYDQRRDSALEWQAGRQQPESPPVSREE